MWRLTLLLLPVMTILLTGFAGGSPSAGLPQTPSPPAPTARPSPPFPSPSPLPSPEPQPAISPARLPAASPTYSGTLKSGDWVQVAGTGACLNVRTQPGVPRQEEEAGSSNPVLNCLPDGFTGWLGDGAWGGPQPVYADGHWWWNMLGQGWVAEDWLAFHHAGGYPWPERPDLADAGSIAYIGPDNNVWLMRADGSTPRLLAQRGGDNDYFSSLSWSPSGDRLALTVSRWSEGEGSQTSTRIIDVNGTLLAEFPGLASARWSPDGRRLSALRVAALGEMMGYHATPMVIDLASGSETPVGPHSMYDSSPAWSPDGSSLALICTSMSMQTYAPDGTPTGEVRMDCNGDGLRVAAADGSGFHLILPFQPEDGVYYNSPAWSPTGESIAVSSLWSSGSCNGYVLVDAETGELGSCFELPPPGGLGGRCGSSEDGAVDWSADGRHLIYHWEFGAGANGVWIVDVATGDRKLVPAVAAASVTVAADGQHMAFDAAGYVWLADMGGSNVTLLGQGAAPVWQPNR